MIGFNKYSLRVFGGALIAAAVACDESVAASGEVVDPNAPVSLVDPARWQPTDIASDPFKDRPADDTCPAFGYGVDAGLFGMYSGDCKYLTAAQGMLTDLQPGDTVTIEVGHGQLLSLEPAEAHMAIAIPGQILWEKRIAIPGPPWFGVIEVPITAAYKAGDPILFHVHNHGPNSYRLVRIERSARL